MPFDCPLGYGDYHNTYDSDKSIPLVQPKRPHKTRDQRRDDNKRDPKHLNKSVCENVWQTTRSQGTLFV